MTVHNYTNWKESKGYAQERGEEKRHPGDAIEDDIKQDGDQTQKQSWMLQVWAN